MRVLVTGAGGFVGGRVARALVECGHAVIAHYRTHIDDETRGHPGIALAQGDLSAGVPSTGALDAVVHCAADIPGLCPDPEKLTHSNVAGAQRLFVHAREEGASSIVFLSSMSVYGNISVPVVTEDLLPDSPDVYGLSKLEVESLLQQMCHDRQVRAGLSIRLPGTVGRKSHHNFLSNTLAKILNGERIRANHPDALFNNIVFVEHLCRFIEWWLTSKSSGYAVTNLAASAPISIKEVVQLLYRCCGREEDVVWENEGKSPFLIDLTHAQSLGYRPATVRESVKAFVRDCLPC